MYTSQENVRIVVAMLKQYNIKHIVISPGGTNIPLSQAVQDDPFFCCYSIPDERSAMYFAIGLYLQTGEIIATSCTSAQATRNYVPGLTEAFYKHVPILAITTAKLERFQYQEYMQAPDQCSLPKDSVKKSFDLPPIKDDNTRIQCAQSVKEAILETTHRLPGPIQLNIRIVDPEQPQFEEVALPSYPKLSRYMAWDEWRDCSLTGKNVLIVVGEHRPFSERLQKAMSSFCESHNAVVYVNHLSNYSGNYSVQANLMVASRNIRDLSPDVLITIGGQTGDYSIYYSLRSLKDIEHWRVAEDGQCVDTYGRLSKIFECPDYYFFERMALAQSVTHSYYEKWKGVNDSVVRDMELPFSNLYVAQQLYERIPCGSIMNFAILNSLRCWNYFPLDESIVGFANVAAFGIDGCNSMLFGESVLTDKLCFIVTGDLAFFYDMNALGIRHLKNNIRVLLINNNGGAEFKIMTKAWPNKVDVDRFISANGHNGSAKGWAENCGFDYITASTKKDFLSCRDSFLSESKKPILFEIFTKEDDEEIAIDTLLSANRNSKSANPVKNALKVALGKSGIDTIKRMMKK